MIVVCSGFPQTRGNRRGGVCVCGNERGLYFVFSVSARKKATTTTETKNLCDFVWQKIFCNCNFGRDVKIEFIAAIKLGNGNKNQNQIVIREWPKIAHHTSPHTPNAID